MFTDVTALSFEAAWVFILSVQKKKVERKNIKIARKNQEIKLQFLEKINNINSIIANRTNRFEKTKLQK